MIDVSLETYGIMMAALMILCTVSVMAMTSNDDWWRVEDGKEPAEHTDQEEA